MRARTSGGRFSPARLDDPHKEVSESRGDVIGIAVGHSSSGPSDAESGGRPDAIERSFVWGGKPPPPDEVSRRRTYDLNKELTDDLSGHVAIEMGGYFISSSSELLVRKMKKRVRKV
jgi:hypothetical protein